LTDRDERYGDVTTLSAACSVCETRDRDALGRWGEGKKKDWLDVKETYKRSELFLEARFAKKTFAKI